MGFVVFGYRRDLLGTAISPVLDHLRWISALVVCWAHTRGFLFPDLASVAQPNIFVRGFYFVAHFGDPVTVFFVVSGLLVGGGVVSRIRNQTFSVKAYAIDRMTRVYIVLLPALTLSLVLQRLVNACNAQLSQYLGSLLFLQNLTLSLPCNNRPLWSLSNEGIYYLVFPAILLAIFGRRKLAAGLLAGTVTAVVIYYWNSAHLSVLAGALPWAAGLIPWFVRIKAPYWIAGGLFLVSQLGMRFILFPSATIGAWCGAISLALMLASDLPTRIPSGAWAARFSYSLYLVHYPLLVAAMHFIGRRDPGSVLSFAIFFALLGGCVLVAWLFGVAFESRTAAVRRWLMSCLMPRNTAVQPKVRPL